jgi:hypothetical protein
MISLQSYLVRVLSYSEIYGVSAARMSTPEDAARSWIIEKGDCTDPVENITEGALPGR